MVAKLKAKLREQVLRIPEGSALLICGMLSVVLAQLDLLTSNEVRAGSNGAWAGVSFTAATLAHYTLHRRKGSLTDTAKKLCLGVREAGYAVSLHRAWWTLGIWFRERGEAGDLAQGANPSHWQFTLDNGWFPTLLVVFIAHGSYRAASAFVSQLLTGVAARVVEIFIVAMAVAWAIPA